MTDTDITGRTSVLVTGPTGGLGRALVAELARRDRDRPLLLAARDVPAARAAAAGAGARAVRAVALDLADLAAVARTGEEVTAAVRAGEVPPLGAVVLNAGVQVTDRRRRSADGHELTFAVNVLAQHQLLRHLLPALAPAAHVVLVGSGTHFGDWRSLGMVAPPRWEDPLDLARADVGEDAGAAVAGQRAYATSKLAVVLLARAWQRRHGEVLRATTYDPGLMPGTGLARDMGARRQWVWRRGAPLLRLLPGATSPATSARHLADLALGRTHPDLRGGYVAGARAARSSAASYDRAREDRLWEAAEALTAAAPQAAAG